MAKAFVFVVGYGKVKCCGLVQNLSVNFSLLQLLRRLFGWLGVKLMGLACCDDGFGRQPSAVTTERLKVGCYLHKQCKFALKHSFANDTIMLLILFGGGLS